MHERPSHSAPYKPHVVGTRKHFFGTKSKKTKRFMIFDPKKGGIFLDTPPTSLKTSEKVGFNWGSPGGGVRTKNSSGDASIGHRTFFN